MASFRPWLALLLIAGMLLSAGAPVIAASNHQEDGEGALTLTPLGTYSTGIFGGSAAEIVSYDAATHQAFVVNYAGATIDVLDLSDPTAPKRVQAIDITPYGAAANSVDVFGGLLAVAVEANVKTDNGSVAFFTTAGEFIVAVEAGALPDMLTFTPDGSKVLVANEGEPNDDYTIDPEGSVTIVDLSNGVENLTQADVTQVSFAKFNDAELDPSIRIYGPNATVAQDLEPEYIAVSPDSTTAWVTLQENNALAIIDIAAGEALTLTSLGLKEWSRPQATVAMYEFTDLPVMGVTEAGQEILLGGFSGLYFEGFDEATGHLQFITHPDRGPNPDPVDVDGDGAPDRPFALPDYQAQWIRFELNPTSGEIFITEQVLLTRPDGTPISGLPNLAGTPGMAYADENPVDLFGNPLELDPYGADMEGIVRADDGSYWMVDEYRPAIYHFAPDGVLINRFVPEGSNASGVDVGVEALPAIFAQRRANRGFEAVALADGILYAFIQSPIDNPDVRNDANSRRGNYIRILAFDTATSESVGQYLYPLVGGAVDKIGDAVALPDGGMLVLERDDAFGPEAQKYIFHIDLSTATNIHGMAEVRGLELQSATGLARAGIHPVEKTLYADLAALGYHMGDKPEGLALIDEQTVAVLNDNDFGISGTFSTTTGLLDAADSVTPIVLGVITFHPTGLDASDRDGGINIRPWPVFGMYQPDAIAAYEANGEVYLVTANEGDARDYPGYSEETRLGSLVLDLAVFPNAAELQQPENLGRLRTTTAGTDTNGDGLVDRILAFGARSFSIWTSAGQLLFDSGSQFEEIIAQQFPDDFNANGENGTFDDRSDDKGAEPEALALGEIDGSIYAFIGLERIGGIMVYNISDPLRPHFVTYVNNRDFGGDAAAGTAGDLAPEGIHFVAAADSPTGQPLLIVANELSGTTTVWEITVNE
jgi:hypothetical protein